VAHAFDPSTWEAEAGGYLSSSEASLLYRVKFQDSQGYTEKACLKKPKKEKEKKKGKKSVF
jgi:streptomycin 6-kinase